MRPIKFRGNTPSENKRNERLKKLGYEEPTKEEQADNINDIIESLNDTPSEKGE